MGAGGWRREHCLVPWLVGSGCLGTWELGAPRPTGAWSRARAGGGRTQWSAGRAGREFGGCSLSLPTVPRVSEDWEGRCLTLCLGGGASDAAPFRPLGENTAPHSKGVCAPPGEDLLCRRLPFWVPRLPTHPLLFKTEVGLGTDGPSQLVLAGSGKSGPFSWSQPLPKAQPHGIPTTARGPLCPCLTEAYMRDELPGTLLHRSHPGATATETTSPDAPSHAIPHGLSLSGTSFF